jgi:hypothetical protein
MEKNNNSEKKSNNENDNKLSVVQLLKYIGLCYDEFKSNKMPIVIPILLYNGKEKWKFAKDSSHLFEDVDEEFKKYIPNFNFEFYDFIKESIRMF